MGQQIDVLGPIFLYWVARLNQKLTFLANLEDSKFLFCTRAGKRIYDQLDAYLDGAFPYDAEVFGVSRISAAKAAIGHFRAFDQAFHICRESLGEEPLGAACAAFLRYHAAEDDPRLVQLRGIRSSFERDNLRVLLAANDDSARYLREYFDQSSQALEAQLKGYGAAERKMVLVDSGWKASIQNLLQKAFPEFRFAGVYFGTMAADHIPDRYSVIFDALSYNPDRPETAFAIHRHLVESLFEPQAKSVEEILGGPCDAIAQQQLKDVLSETPDAEGDVFDALFVEVLEYTRAHAKDPFDEIVHNYQAALQDLRRILLFPTREEVPLFAGKPRSRDFGRSGYVPTLRELSEGNSAEERVSLALWPQGQIALEYSPETAKDYQARATGIENQAEYFSSYTGRAAAKAKQSDFDWEGSVAVVTRTKNRPLLFERAMRSVACQTHRNFHWVIVNDGGYVGDVLNIIENSPIDRRRITLVSNSESVGMEAASNLGVRAVDTEFVVIHDDDDTWKPEFLEKCVRFLKSPAASSAGFDGVLTRAFRISEEIRNGEVIQHGQSKFQPWVNDVTLFQMAIGNFFAPISFVYRRSVFNDIGGYSEKLPVLGDWRFNIDFLARSNIGFLDEYLSYYHHRDVGSTSISGVYGNSVIGGRSVHATYFPVVVNDLLRDPALPPAVATVLAQAHSVRVLEHRFNLTDQRLHALEGRLPRTEGDEEEAKPSTHEFLQLDREHVTRSIVAALREDQPDDRKGALENALSNLHLLGDAAERERVLRPVAFAIPSPPNFDHIRYLKKRVDLWATPFNGINEMLPYHHYLLRGIAEGEERPTI